MEKFVASVFLENGHLSLYLDDLLIKDLKGLIELNLEKDEEYVVHWMINGKPGNMYSISVSSPASAQFVLTRLIGEGGKEFGGYKFKI